MNKFIFITLFLVGNVFSIPSTDFNIYNNKIEKVLESGSFTIGIDSNSSDLN